MKVAGRANAAPFEVMAILDRVARLRAQGRDIVSLCAGEPSQGAPAAVHRAAETQHRDRRTLTYSPAFGFEELRDAIAGHYRRWYDLEVDRRDVGVTTGASGAFVAVFLAAFDPGDRVALVRPGYPAYRNLLRTLGMEPVEVPVGARTGFQPTVEQLDAVHREGPLTGLVLASPANPTGSMVDRSELTSIAEWCSNNGVRLISDEIYHGITAAAAAAQRDGTAPPLDHRGVSAWEIDRSSVVVSSFSKYWGMTGWRLGWVLLPEDLRGPVENIIGNAALCAPTPAQAAALSAFEDDSYAECDARVVEFDDTRRLVLGRLGELGWGPVAPSEGAFYLWAGLGDRLGRHGDSAGWCRALLDEAGVAVVPGLDFDPVDGGGFIRLSFAAGTDAVADAIDRIVAWQS